MRYLIERFTVSLRAAKAHREIVLIFRLQGGEWCSGVKCLVWRSGVTSTRTKINTCAPNCKVSGTHSYHDVYGPQVALIILFYRHCFNVIRETASFPDYIKIRQTCSCHTIHFPTHPALFLFTSSTSAPQSSTDTFELIAFSAFLAEIKHFSFPTSYRQRRPAGCLIEPCKYGFSPEWTWNRPLSHLISPV